MKLVNRIAIASIFLLHFIGVTSSLAQTNTRQPLYFDKVIIWGHKLHSHTHSYVHYAFHRTFEHMGYKTYWFDDRDDVSNFNFANSLFIVAGSVDRNIPLRDDCRYVLHNCDDPKYKKLQEQGNCLILQVYSHDCLKRNVEKWDECIYFDLSAKCLYQPWATDLLPYEIDAVKQQIRTAPTPKENAVYMAASIGGGDKFENWSKHDRFRKACLDHGVQWENMHNISMEENITITQRSLIAPAIQSQWQCDVGYIPCRIFKNISYGQFGSTNSETVYKLFNKKIVYNPNTYQLFKDTVDRTKNLTQAELFELMDFVRDEHTYVNRIHTIFYALNKIKLLEN